MVKYQHVSSSKNRSDWFDEQKCVIYASKISEEYKNSEPWCSTEIIRTRLYLRNYFLLLPESQQFSRWRRRGSRQQQLVGIDFPQRCNQYKMLYTISLFPINNTVYETTQFVDWLNLTAHRHVRSPSVPVRSIILLLWNRLCVKSFVYVMMVAVSSQACGCRI